MSEPWKVVLDAMDRRADAIRELQEAADKYAQCLTRASEMTEHVWSLLPVHPHHRPATYGRDLYARAAAYLYGATDGKSSDVRGLSAQLARKRPDLITLDRGAREILLLPYPKE